MQHILLTPHHGGTVCAYQDMPALDGRKVSLQRQVNCLSSRGWCAPPPSCVPTLPPIPSGRHLWSPTSFSKEYSQEEHPEERASRPTRTIARLCNFGWRLRAFSHLCSGWALRRPKGTMDTAAEIVPNSLWNWTNSSHLPRWKWDRRARMFPTLWEVSDTDIACCPGSRLLFVQFTLSPRDWKWERTNPVSRKTWSQDRHKPVNRPSTGGSLFSTAGEGAKLLQSPW